MAADPGSDSAAPCVKSCEPPEPGECISSQGRLCTAQKGFPVCTRELEGARSAQVVQQNSCQAALDAGEFPRPWSGGGGEILDTSPEAAWGRALPLEVTPRFIPCS